jgi:signal transduction histidine kinase
MKRRAVAPQRQGGGLELLAASKRRVLLRDTALVLLLNAVVAIALFVMTLSLAPQLTSIMRNQVLLSHMVFSQAIGLSIFGLIEWLRLTLWWGRRPGLAALGLATAVAIPLGYLVGSGVASMLLSLPLQWPGAPGSGSLLVLLATVLASLAAVYAVTQRDRLEAEQLRAENADIRASSARLQLLQQQIEPHMLFNSLANVHALIDTEPVRAQQLLEALSELLHASMQAGEQPLVSLRSEFDLLEHYLRLMAIRMGPRLRYSTLLPAELERVPLPPLSLQPLVENAVKHGLDPQPGGGCIQVVARRDGQRLVVEVIDDGQGLRVADPFAAGRVGLGNVRKRLTYAFGEGASLQLADNPPHGVRAILTFAP